MTAHAPTGIGHATVDITTTDAQRLAGELAAATSRARVRSAA